MTAIVEQIERLFRERGDGAYFGESVTQTEHALQSAWLAEQERANAALITAALLHDIGHLLHGHGEDCAEQGIDDEHEALGGRYLTRHFGPAVVEPVRLHVIAKRYLAAREPGYFESLSPASVLSLKLQGGPMNPDEAQQFEANPHFAAAVALRRWDEQAKIARLPTPDLAHFLPYVQQSAAKE
jgi:phosphonate degradation associated HDIG domain protein